MSGGWADTRLKQLPQPLLYIAKATVFALPALTFLSVWLPEVRHYSVPEASISDAALTEARQHPADDVLSEIREFYLFPFANRDPALETRLAEQMLQGTLQIPDVPRTTFHLRFTPDDLEDLPEGARLWFAAFAVPDFLLAAYTNTKREEFFTAARDFLLSWGAYEKRAWLPKGLLWNDHATAARVRVLGEFWRLYRHRPDYDPAVGRAVLQQAARYGEFLLSPEHFTFATNHGVMQNIGLLHLSLAFPSLAKSDRYKHVAVTRLGEQMAFFIDTAGIVREHSAGYQVFGLEMLGIAFRSLTLHQVPVPADWALKYRRGLTFLAQLRRPDGTLPSTGDTDGARETLMPRVITIDSAGWVGARHAPTRWHRDDGTSVHPGAGYWVDWSDQGQTVVSWTRRPPPGHKHADELNVLVWSDSISWLTSVGYWPYGSPGRDVAESWDGSNAPHLENESFESLRNSRLVSSGRGAHMAAADLERAGPGAFLARRQVIRIEPDLWVVVDHVRAEAQRTRTVWTFPPDVNVRPDDSAGSYELTTARPGTTARATFLSSDGTVLKDYRGSDAPFAGWHVVHSAPLPTTAVVVDQPAGESWLAVVLASKAGAGSGAASGLAPGSSAENWALALPTSAGVAELRRRGDQLTFSRSHRPGSVVDTLLLMPGPDPTPELQSIRAAYQAAAPKYPRFQEQQAPRRVKVRYLLLVLFVGQELFFLVFRRAAARWYLALRLTSTVCWVGVAGWLHYFFIPTWAVLTP